MSFSLTLPVAAIAGLAGFNGSAIESENHYTTTFDSTSSIWPWRSYKTSSHHPPQLNITVHEPGASSNYVFLSPAAHNDMDGTYELSGTGFIMTSDGDMVYAAEETGYGFCGDWVAGMTDFRKQNYKGRPYITYWNGCNTRGAHWGHRWGQVTFIDEEYSSFTINPDLGIHTLDDANRGQIDMHEHQMTDDDTLLVTSFDNSIQDLRDMGNPNATWVAESMFFELDIPTQKVLFSWRAMDHVPMTDSSWGLSGRRGSLQVPWDWFHINSVQKVGKDYLISARHHHAVLLISGDDGRILWKFNGLDGGTFDSSTTPFRWQHHARAQNITEHGMTISLFDNHVAGVRTESMQSRALAFWIPFPYNFSSPPQMTRKLYTTGQPIFSATQGSYQLDVGNGNGFVGYGKVPLLREYAPEPAYRDLLWEARFGYDGSAMSYRAFKDEWHGTPKHWDPVVVFERSEVQNNRHGYVYVSWNGATDISHWAIFAGINTTHLDPVGVAEKKGFETKFEMKDGSWNCVQLGAVRGHHIIRKSNIACQNATLLPDDRPASVVQPISRPASATDMGGGRLADAALLSEIHELKKELAKYESGLWLSQDLFVDFAFITIIIVSSFMCFAVWRKMRIASVARGILGQGRNRHAPTRSGSWLRLGLFRYAKGGINWFSPRLSSDIERFEGMTMVEESTTVGMLQRQQREAEDSSSESDSRTRLIRLENEDR